MVKTPGAKSYEVEAREVRIRKYLEEGLTRNKIAELEGIHVSQVDTAIHTIHEQDKILWKDQAHESIEGRALLIKEKYEKIAKISEKIVDDPNVSAKDLEIAAKLLLGSHNEILKMLREGPQGFRNKVLPIEDKSDGL